jgi:hypothetical protein
LFSLHSPSSPILHLPCAPAHEITPDDFVQNLRADRDAIGPASDTVEGKRQQGVEDTARIGIGLTEAYKEIRALNAIMHNKYSRLPEKLRAWRSATHIERAPERPKKNGGSAPATKP